MNSFFFVCIRRATLCWLLGAHSLSNAFTLSNGDQVQCPVTRNGQSGFATEIWSNYNDPSERDPELGRAVAVMRLDANDWPTIIIDAQAYERTSKGTPAQWDFVYFHECAHAQKPALTEIGTKLCSVCEKAESSSLCDGLQLEGVDEFLSQMPVDNFSGGCTWHVLGL
jgi:hypothetical protein